MTKKKTKTKGIYLGEALEARLKKLGHARWTEYAARGKGKVSVQMRAAVLLFLYSNDDLQDAAIIAAESLQERNPWKKIAAALQGAGLPGPMDEAEDADADDAGATDPEYDAQEG